MDGSRCVESGPLSGRCGACDPLQNEGWYAVKAMVRRREAHRIMDELSRAGCKGILLTSIESARI